MVLSRTEKINLVKSLSPSQKEEIKKALSMGGNGIKEVVQKVSATLKPIIKVVGPVLLREILLPALKKKIMGEGKKCLSCKTGGKGLKTAGGALRLAGQKRRNTM